MGSRARAYRAHTGSNELQCADWKLTPVLPLACFHASLQEALKDFVRLRDMAPEESNVVFQLAKLFRIMGDDVRAAQHLAMARDISPKSLGKVSVMRMRCFDCWCKD